MFSHTGVSPAAILYLNVNKVLFCILDDGTPQRTIGFMATRSCVI